MQTHSIIKICFFFIALLIFSPQKAKAQSDASLEFSRQWETKLLQATSPSASTQREHNRLRPSLTMIILEGQKNRDLLTSRLQKVLETYEERPNLSNVVASTHFRFHYETTGVDAVNPADDNENDIPDYIEFMAAEFENVYQKEIEGLGFVAPPSDGTEGGGEDFYDVYVFNLQRGLYGFVSPERRVGDNPNSSVREDFAYTSWMAVRNDYEDFGLEEDALRVTAAHEYFHAIQLGYNGDAIRAFAFEGSAAWMEEKVYPNVDDNFQYLESVFRNPDVAINYGFEDEDDPDFIDFENYWYGSWIFFQYIDENIGAGVIRKFWENMRSTDQELEAMDRALATENTSLQSTFEDFLVANIILSSDPSSQPYIYSRASDYLNYVRANLGSETIQLEGNIEFLGRPIAWQSESQGNRRLMRLSGDYFEFSSQEKDFRISLLPNQNGKAMGVQLVELKQNRQVRVLKEFQSDGEIRLEAREIDNTAKLFLIVYRGYQTSDDFSSEQYQIRISAIDEVQGIGDDLEENDYFTIAPNPVQGNLRFIYNLSQTQNYSVQITDALGRKIVEKENLSEALINTSKWAKGTYFVTLFENEQPIALRKIVVQ